ncbi:MAG: pyrroline-5-carboxylate reductase [Oscillospiraceae bacterium]|nr:pyrroline-5-carboxylate reductase [Oscillospiraceae bacterium]
MFKYKFGVIGAGNMGMAITNGIVGGKIMTPQEIGIYVHSPEKVPAFEEKGFAVCKSSAEAYKNSQFVLLGVKPQIVSEVLDEISTQSYDGQIIISIVAGVSIKHIQSCFKDDVKVIRVMPNTPLLIGKGASAFSRSNNVSDDEFEQVINIFSLMGSTEVIDESLMNEIIPVNGSSPAFVYYIINCMLESSVKNGIDPAVAQKLICDTFIGAANMITQTDTPIPQLIKNVCSPGGTTLEAIKVFDEHNLGLIFDEAFEKCIKRAYEIGK